MCDAEITMKRESSDCAGWLRRGLLVAWLAGGVAAAQPEELQALEGRWNKLVEERVEAPFAREMERLSKSYLAALDREIVKRRKAANLDELVIFTDERKRVEEGRELAGDESTDPPLLKDLRKAWRESVAKPREARELELAKLLRQYQSNLSKLEERLTQEGRVDDALAVRNARSTVDARLGGVPAGTGAEGPAVEAPPLPPELKEKPPQPANTRSLAAWAMKQPGAGVGIRDSKGFRWLKNENDNRKDEALPEGDFSLVRLEVMRLPDEGKKEFRPDWLLGQTQLEELRLDMPFRDFAVLRGMKLLRRLEFVHMAVVSDDDLLRLPELPELRSAYIGGSYGDLGIAIMAARMPALEKIWIQGSSITPAGLRPLGRLRGLASLSLRGTEAVSAACTALPPLKLESMGFSSVSRVPPEVWGRLKIPPSTGYLEIYDGELTAGSLEAVNWSTAASLEKLSIRLSKSSPPAGLRGLNAAKALKSLQVEGIEVDARELAALELAGRLESLRISGADRWTDEEVAALLRRTPRLDLLHLQGLKLGDSLVNTVVECLPRLRDLALRAPGLSDACTVPLDRLKALEVLALECPGLTPAGLAEIKQARKLSHLILHQPKLPRAELDLFGLENRAIRLEIR